MSGLTGIENPLQVAIVLTLQIGGATLRSVVVLILDDDNLKLNFQTSRTRSTRLSATRCFRLWVWLLSSKIDFCKLVLKQIAIQAELICT